MIFRIPNCGYSWMLNSFGLGCRLMGKGVGVVMDTSSMTAGLVDIILHEKYRGL